MPLVEIDGMELTQIRAILSYLAAKYNLHGKDPKETVRYQSARANTWFWQPSSVFLHRDPDQMQPFTLEGGEETRGQGEVLVLPWYVLCML